MKTKGDIIQEAENYFGINVFSNDDGISRRVNHYAMELWAKEVIKNLPIISEKHCICHKHLFDSEWDLYISHL